MIRFENEFPAKAAEEGNDKVLCVGRARFAKHLTNTSFPGTTNLRGGGLPLCRGGARPRGDEPGVGPLVTGGIRPRRGRGRRPQEGFAEPPAAIRWT